MPQKPKIKTVTALAESRLFRIEEIALEFSNGEKRIYERFQPSGRYAVMMVPLLDNDTILLVREYALGVEDYVLAFPKGLIDKKETSIEAANRELMEEIGYGAHQLEPLSSMSLSIIPGYTAAKMDVVLARDLYPKRLPGDEPEPLEVVPWSLQKIPQLLAQPDFHEARSIAALYLLQQRLAQH